MTQTRSSSLFQMCFHHLETAMSPQPEENMTKEQRTPHTGKHTHSPAQSRNSTQCNGVRRLGVPVPAVIKPSLARPVQGASQTEHLVSAFCPERLRLDSSTNRCSIESPNCHLILASAIHDSPVRLHHGMCTLVCVFTLFWK